MIDYKTFARSTRAYYCGPEGFQSFLSLYKERFSGKPFFLVADENTMKAAGRELEKTLLEAGIVKKGEFVYPGDPILEADYRNSLPLKSALAHFPGSCPIAVGSGTLNDLAKIACAELNRPYAVFATAASVDGYASDGAALVKNGFKQTLRCPAPELIAADLQILQAAPESMTASGYADLIAKIPAGADWLLADILKEDPIHKEVWDFIQIPLRDWISLPLDQTKLFEGLTATGFAMQHIQQSRPASGAEHLISHIWEMEHLTHNGQSFSHGFKVGIGSILSTALMEMLLESPLGEQDIKQAKQSYRPLEERLKEAETFFSGPQLMQIKEVVKEKNPTRKEHEKRVLLSAKHWPEIQSALKKQILPLEELTGKLKEAGCPVELKQLGITPEQALLTMKKAQQIRKRYTILDLVDDLGWWERGRKVCFFNN